MGFLGNIAGAAFRALVPPIAQSAIRAVAPAATDLLKKIVGSGFDVVKFAAPFAVAGALPGPLGMIAGALLGPVMGKGIDALKNWTTTGLENFVRQFVGQPQPRELVGSPAGNTVTPSPLPQRASQSFASSVVDTVTNVASSILPSFGRSTEDQLAGAAAGLKEPAFPGANASEGELLQYQTALQKYARLMDMYSKIIQAHHDMKKGIIANFRV
jgi:hypothetical protein